MKNGYKSQNQQTDPFMGQNTGQIRTTAIILQTDSLPEAINRKVLPKTRITGSNNMDKISTKTQVFFQKSTYSERLQVIGF